MRRRNTADSNTYRFFVAPDAISGDAVLVRDEALARQVAGVLRLQAGDIITLLDDSGWRYRVELTALPKGQIEGRILAREEAAGEPRVRLTLYQALLRGERFEWVLQKSTEVGAAAIVPVGSARATVGADDAGERKHERWRRILREAAEQSRRAHIPALAAPVPFAAACAAAATHDLALLLWEGEAPPLRHILRERLAAGPVASVALISGPEGGLTPEEVALAQGQGVTPVSLGPRTLRAETAPLVAATALLYELGDLA